MQLSLQSITYTYSSYVEPILHNVSVVFPRLRKDPSCKDRMWAAGASRRHGDGSLRCLAVLPGDGFCA